MTSGAPLRGSRVLVTGATGFIGSRLARRLAVREEARVTGAGRELDRVRHLEEHGVRLVRADLLRSGALDDRVEGEDVVFHLAAWSGGDPGRAHAVNVTATEGLVRTAARAGVRRFVHVSTIAAYGLPERRVVDEESPLATDADDPYARTKARGEIRAREAAGSLGLELAVLRPAMVYGPGSTVWTTGLYRRVRRGRPVLVGDGSGHFHPLFIDNLLDALVLAATSSGAPGEAFNVSEEPVTWTEYLRPYAELAGRELRSVPLWLARLVAAAAALPGVRPPLDPPRLAFATGRFVFPVDRARRRLGWSPRIGLEEGMERTAAWLREEGLA